MNNTQPSVGLPQRSVSGGGHAAIPQHVHSLKHPANLSSRLNHTAPTRSISYNHVVDLTTDGNASGYPKKTTTSGVQPMRVASMPVQKESIDLEGKDSERPAKRMKILDEGSRAEEEAVVSSPMAIDEEATVEDSAHRVLPGSPLPAPPKGASSRSKGAVGRGNRKGGNHLLRKANGIYAPAMAVRLPHPKNVADFAPWTGQHPEDILNEQVVKAGYFDKGAGANQSESGSAAPTIRPTLSQKNNIGLQTLSHLFVQVLEKRQATGKCTAPSSFKPPPRVTVTDTKREAWLRDLANPEVPLRKQSRTIPHGIRGKLLMEQCLGKNIPLQRAIWLAKCVGANELRAFRRKGVSGAAATGGESKWMREWTLQVEQFLEGIIAGCGSVGDWKMRMDYALKLSTHFYTERLLECEHYLDWIVGSFAEASLERLPIWIILVQTYWNSITAFGRRGRALALAILRHLRAIQTSGHVTLAAAVKLRLERLLVIMATTKRASLIIPRRWDKFRDLLSVDNLPSFTGEVAAAALRSIVRRNERLAAPLRTESKATRSPTLRIIDLLDNAGLEIDVSAIADRVLALAPDTTRLVTTLLQWASSKYRQGHARIHLAAGVIAHLHDNGVDINAMTLEFLRQNEGSTVVEAENVYSVVFELVRLRSFSIGRFMQWLMTSGILYADGKTPGLVAGLLRALPSEGSHAGLRKTLLDRLGVTSDYKKDQSVLQYITDAASQLEEGESLPDQHSVPITLPDRFTSQDKAAVLRWATAKLETLSKHGNISLALFCLLREVVERAVDTKLLILLLRVAMSTDVASVLASATETVNFHAETLAAFGELGSLVDDFIGRYKTLRTQQPLDRAFVLALTGLVKRIPDKATFAKPLAQDLIYCEQQNSTMACSPASDNMTSMQASNLECDADIDAVFASGNTMDEQLMHRVFTRIMHHANKHPASATTHMTGKLGVWLNQLRSLDTHGFEILAREYVRSAAHGGFSRTAWSDGATALIACNCLPFDAVIEPLWMTNASEAAVTALRFMTAPAAGKVLTPVELYRFALYQRRYVDEHVDTVIMIARRASADRAFPAEDEALRDLMAYLAIRSSGKVFEGIGQEASSGSMTFNIVRLYKHILGPQSNIASAQGELGVQAVARSVDALAVPYCQELLRVASRDGKEAALESRQSLKVALIEAIKRNDAAWPQLLECVDVALLKDINVWARGQLLASIEKSEDCGSAGVNVLLQTIDTTHVVADQDGHMHMLTALIDRLRAQDKQFAELDTSANQDGSFSNVLRAVKTSFELVATQLSASLESEGSTQKMSSLLATACALLLQPRLQLHQDVVEYIFDVASAVSDSLPDEAVAALAHAATLSNLASNPRIASILGTSTSPDAWLALAFRPQQQAGPHSQRLLLSRQPTQQQVSGRANPVQSQQQPHPQHQRAATPLGVGGLARGGLAPVEMKTVPYMLRRWETMPDPTPVMGENDTSLSLTLFGARKV